MKFYVDLHLHSHFSRATSKTLNLEHLSKWAQLKGIQVVGTGDFVHPGWLQELQEKLQPAEEGLFKLKSDYARKTQDEVPAACKAPVRFMLTAEISNIYKRLGKVRKVHNVLFVPHFEVAEKIQARLEAIGNIRSDGRPILGLDSRDLLEIVLETDPLAFLIPAHIWTPWFSALGSKGGFDRIVDCFGDLSPHIFAVETGLSSDPPMNWRLTQLDPYLLVSNSDAHSPAKLAREATIFNTDLSYPALHSALSDPADPGLTGTVEFFPEEGKYHYDGHRKCGIRMHPRETIANEGLCPVCGKPVTVGVMARVEELADRPEGENPPRWRPYHSLIPLPEVIAEVKKVGPNSKAVQSLFQRLLAKLGNEMGILLDASLEDINAVGGPVLAEGIRRMRAGEVNIAAGYDGAFGVIHLFAPEERNELGGQTSFLPDQEQCEPGKRPSPTQKQGPQGYAEEETGRAGGLKPKQPYEQQAGRVKERFPSEAAADLNAAQNEAVGHRGSHLLIIAGPGTGKTHTLTYRIAHLARNRAAPQSILAVTFTNKAAEEMRERLVQRLGDEAEKINVGTFHRFCLQFLRNFADCTDLPVPFRIATPADIDRVARQLWDRQSMAQRRDRLEAISRWKAGGQTGKSPDSVSAYDRLLRENGLLDFDDLILETLKLLRANKKIKEQIRATYRFIFVDEYQDINAVQHALLKELVQEGVQLTAIGDPNQAIYGFRGAEVRFFTRFSRDFPGAKTLYLAENYRSASNLLMASEQVIGKTGLAEVPPLTAKMYLQGRLTIYEAPTDKAEAEYVVHQVEKLLGGTSMFSQDSGRVASEVEAERSFGDVAVLYRLNSQRPVLEEAFLRSGIPYQVSGDKPLISQPAVFELTTLLRLSHGTPVTPEAARRLLTFVVAGIGEKTGAISEALWRKEDTREVSLHNIGSLLKQEGFLSVGARIGLKRFLQETEEVAAKLRDSGINAALQHLKTVPGWQRFFSEKPAIEESRQKLMRLARRHKKLDDYLDHLLLHQENEGVDEGVERVSLLTLHAAKGLEFPVVFMVGCEQELLPLQYQGLGSDREEERRLFYVGMTRAREQLYLVRAKRRSLFGQTYQTEPSPFVSDIEEQLKTYEKAEQRGTRRGSKDQAEQLNLFGNG